MKKRKPSAAHAREHKQGDNTEYEQLKGSLIDLDEQLDTMPVTEPHHEELYQTHLKRASVLCAIKEFENREDSNWPTDESDLKGVFAELRRAKRLIPNKTEAYELESVLYVRLGNPAGCLWPFAELAQNYPDHPCSHILAAEVLLHEGRAAEAYEDARRAAELMPDFFSAHATLARVAEALGKDDEVTQSLERYLALLPRSPELVEAYNQWDQLGHQAADGIANKKCYRVIALPDGPRLTFTHTDEGKDAANSVASFLHENSLLLRLLGHFDTRPTHVEITEWHAAEWELLHSLECSYE